MPAPEIAVRPIAAGDRAEWERLFTAYGEFYETTFDRSVLDAVWAWLMDDESPLSATVATVATNGDTVVGFAHVKRSPDTFTGGSGWVLDDLYVEPSSRGMGLATALIDAAAARAAAEGGGTLRWITASDNVAAQRVYARVATRTSWVTYEREAH